MVSASLFRLVDNGLTDSPEDGDAEPWEFILQSRSPRCSSGLAVIISVSSIITTPSALIRASRLSVGLAVIEAAISAECQRAEAVGLALTGRKSDIGVPVGDDTKIPENANSERYENSVRGDGSWAVYRNHRGSTRKVI